MPNELNCQDLMEAFFSALGKRDINECETILAQLLSLSNQRPAYVPWCAYLEGILLNERDRDWAKAERIFNRLLKSDLDLPLHGRVLLALGLSYQYQGRWEDAIRAYGDALPLFTELDRPVDQVKAWKQMAICYRRGFTRGDFGPEALQLAIEHCQLALGVLEPIPDPSPNIAWLKGSVWNTLGLIHGSLGQWDEAINCYEQDLDICESLDDRFGIGLSYGNIAEIHQKRGRNTWPQALQAYQKALSIIREFDDRYEETEALANLGFLHQEMGQDEPALDYYGQAIYIIEEMRAGISAEAARAGFFATIIDTYANAVLLCLEAGREAQAFDYVERARSRAFLDVLTAGSPQLSREMAVTPMTLSEVQTALPTDTILIEYFTTGLVEARNDRVSTEHVPQRHRFPPAKTLLFVVTRDGLQVHDVDLSPNDLLPRQLDSVVERHFLKPQIRQTLYERLIAPAVGLIRGRRRLYLIPHGPLHYIPFQALIAPDGETLLRDNGPQLVYAPSATILFRCSREVPDRAPLPCLALGFNGTGKFQLHFAEEEARCVIQQTGGHVLAGPASKRAALYEQAANYRVLHFSCHGEFDPESPLTSALHLAPEEALTALDVMEHLRLNCDLVTLSACESGLSRVRRGDELIGLIRAFMHAGAPVLLSTLWRVDERSTSILMEQFYRNAQTGMDFAEALQKAQLYLKNLTRREIVDVLARFLADEMLQSASPADESRAKIPAPAADLDLTGAYLKALDTQGGRESKSLLDQVDGDNVFMDPYFWAPFVLVGSCELGTLKE